MLPLCVVVASVAVFSGVGGAVPGALIGVTLGTRLQGRIDERASKVFLAWRFLG